MRKIGFSIFIVLVFNMLANAQSLKKITASDFENFNIGNYSNYDAVVLNSYGNYGFDIYRETLRFVRRYKFQIYILTEAGKEKFSKITIPFRNTERFEEAFIDGARCYNLVDGRVKKTKLKRRNINNLNDFSAKAELNFEIPDVSVGSIIEYEYIIYTNEWVCPPAWLFQWDIPVINSEFRIAFPQNFGYDFYLTGEIEPEISEKIYTHSFVWQQSYSYRRATQIYRRKGMFNCILPGTQYIFKAANIPAYTAEDYILNQETNRAKVQIHLKAVDKNVPFLNVPEFFWNDVSKVLILNANSIERNYTEYNSSLQNYPSGYILYAKPDAETFGNQLFKHDDFGFRIAKIWRDYTTLKNICPDSLSEIAKAEALYNFLSEKIICKPDSEILCKRPLTEVFESKYASATEINLLYINMLNRLEIKAFPLVVQSRESEFADLEIIDISVFNRAMSYIVLGDTAIVCDLSEKSNSFGKLAPEFYGAKAIIVKNTESELINIETVTHKTNCTWQINLAATKLTAELKRHENTITNSNSAYNLLFYNSLISPQALCSDSSTIIENSTIKFTELFNLVIDNEAFSINLNEISCFENPLKTNFRRFPFELYFPVELNYKFIIEIPENLNLIEQPKSFNFQTESKSASINYAVSQIENSLYVNFNINIYKLTFNNEDYYELKTLIEKAENLLNSPINFEVKK